MLSILLTLNSLDEVINASEKIEIIKKKHPYAQIIIRVQSN